MGDIAELERAVEAIPVIGDRYDAEQQSACSDEVAPLLEKNVPDNRKK